jgi:four helix bundle protein
MKENILKSKSFEFAVQVITISQQLKSDHREFELSKQLIKSGTATGALIREAEQAESKKDFVHKLSIALKEANETNYWLDLLLATKLISKEEHHKISGSCLEIVRLLAASVKTSKSKYLSGNNV